MRERLRALARRARDVFPLTWLGVAIGTLAGVALWWGLGRLDLILLGASIIALATLGIALITVALATLRVRAVLRRATTSDTPIAIECGFPVRTGFRLPRVRWLPGVRVTWRWIDPGADVRLLAAGGWLEEEVIPHARGWSDTLRRRVEIGDAFGLASIALEHVEARQVRMLPSVGGLKQMNVVRTLSGGSDITHPEGSPDGERLDLRQYAPGDPIRFVLWSVFARTRQLVIRTPERALSHAKKTLAYLVTGAADEPAAGAARVAVDVGALGGDWSFGADGVDEPASTKDAALEALARSATAPRATAGEGLAAFMRRAADGGAGRAVVFVPGKPGPWLDGVMKAAAQLSHDATGRAPLEFIVCTDGVRKARGASMISRFALADANESSAHLATVAQDELARVVSTLGTLRAKITVVDRRDGHVHARSGGSS